VTVGISSESATPLKRSTRSASILEHITEACVTRRDKLRSMIKRGRTDSTCGDATSHATPFVDDDWLPSGLLQSCGGGEPGHARSND
jgi:hypothetical protein